MYLHHYINIAIAVTEYLI